MWTSSFLPAWNLNTSKSGDNLTIKFSFDKNKKSEFESLLLFFQIKVPQLALVELGFTKRSDDYVCFSSIKNWSFDTETALQRYVLKYFI